MRQAVVECLGIGPAIDREHELDIGTQAAGMAPTISTLRTSSYPLRG